MAKFRRVRTIETDIMGLPVIEGKTINSKRKGNANELVSAKWTMRWTNQPFARVPRSGGARWKNASRMCGDIVPEDEDFKFEFTIETKHLKAFETKAKLTQYSKVHTVWMQVTDDSVRSGKLPMVLLRRNGMAHGTYFVFVQAWIMEFLVQEGSDFMFIVELSTESGEIVYGFDSEKFLENVNYLRVSEFLSKFGK